MAKDSFLEDAATLGNGSPVAPVRGASSSGGGADARGSAIGTADVHSEMFRSLADHSLEFIGMSDLALKPFYVNAAGIRMVGLDSLEEACAVKVQDFFFPEDQRYITEEFLPKVLREGRGEVEIRFRHFKTGAALWMIYNVFHVRDARGQVSGYATVSRNITERKQTEQALRESEEKHRLLFDTMVEGFGLNEIILDADGKPCDWRFLELNTAWEQQTGLVRTDVVGKTMRQVWPDLDACWLEKFAKVALSGEPLRSEGYNPHLQGWYEVLAYRTKPNQFAVVFADITERKRAEEALRESEAKYRSLFNSLDDGFCIFEVLFGADGRANDYRFVEVNAAFERHTGLKGAEGKTIREMVPDQDAHWFETYGKVALTGEPKRFEARSEALKRYFEVYAFRVGKPEQRKVAALFRDETQRKQAEEALQKSEARWNAALESFADGAIIATDAEEVIYWNPAARQMHGFKSPDEGIQPLADTPKTFELWTPDAGHLLTLDEWPMKRIKRGERVHNLELRLRRPDQGWERFVSYSGAMVVAGGQRLIFLSVHDLTEQRKAEQALRQSEEQFRLLYEKAPLGIARIDSSTGRFLLINAKYCDILQRSEAEALRLDFQTVTHPDDVALDLQNMQRLREGLCQSFQMDKRYLRPDGSIVWVNLTVVPEWAEGQPVSAHIAMVTDITDRKRAEEALEGSEMLYRAIGESIDYGIWICDAQGRNIYASDSFLKLTGINQEQCSEFGWGDTLHPDDTAATIQAWKQCVQSGGPWYREHRFRGADGQWHPILACGVAVRNERGEITRWAGINLDISQLKQTEEDLRKARDELAESNAELERLVAERTAKLQELVGELEHFSYTITHDLKAPLRAMRGFAEIASEICGSTEARPFLEKISVSAERMDRLISDALNYSRSVRQELPLEDVDVGALLRGMLDSYPELQPDKACILVEGLLPVVLGNQAGLTQCFSNLLANAVKFVQPAEQPDIRIRSTHRGEWVRIWVEDKGIGISKQMLPRVFEMFSRGSKDYEGTGIGLALVRKVVQRMGGKVGVESEEGKGSRFWIELGRGEARAALAQPAAHQSLASAGEATVLYVEDEENDALFMERAFAEKGLGQKLRLVTTGRAAINYLSGSGEFADRAKYPLPSVVLLDLNLPQVSGFGVLEWIRNHPDYARLPVVMFSSSTREDDRTKARELGANDFVAKPSSGLEFGTVVEELRRKWIGGKLKAR